jgi:hypothetical protein
MKRNISRIVAAAGVVALAAVGTAAQARGNVAFSVGINAAPAPYYGYGYGPTYAPAYGPAPVYVEQAYVAPQQVYVAPQQQVYVAPQQVYVQPAPVYVAPRPVYVAPPVVFGLGIGYGGYYGGHRHWR